MTEPSLDLNATIKINSDILSVDMDGDIVAMDMNNNQFFGINDIGSQIWHSLEEKEQTLAELYQSLIEHFREDDPEQIKSELTSFLLHCQGYNVLSIT